MKNCNSCWHCGFPFLPWMIHYRFPFRTFQSCKIHSSCWNCSFPCLPWMIHCRNFPCPTFQNCKIRSSCWYCNFPWIPCLPWRSRSHFLFLPWTIHYRCPCPTFRSCMIQRSCLLIPCLPWRIHCRFPFLPFRTCRRTCSCCNCNFPVECRWIINMERVVVR